MPEEGGKGERERKPVRKGAKRRDSGFAKSTSAGAKWMPLAGTVPPPKAV